MNPTGNQNTGTWLRGLPFAGDRPMTDDERATVERMMRRSRRNVLLYILLTPASIALFVLVLSYISAESPLLYAIGVAIVSSPAVSILGIRDELKRSRGLRRDLRLGTISVFVSAFEADDFYEVLNDDGTYEAVTPQEQRIEILPGSERLWSVNQVRHAKWQVEHRTAVAATPEYAASAADWVTPVDPGNPDAPHLNYRDMSAAEKAEVARHIRRLRRRTVPVTLGVNVWLSMGVFAAIYEHRLPRIFTFYLLAIGVLVSDFLTINDWLLALRLRRDLRNRRIVIARMPLGPSGTAGLSEAVEILPSSRMNWTARGQAAAWRIMAEP